MDNLPTINLWLKNAAPDKNGLQPIVIRVTFNRNRLYKYTKYKAAANNFDQANLIGSKDPNFAYKNADIKDQVNKLEREFINLDRDGKLNAEYVKEVVSGNKQASNVSFHHLCVRVRGEYENILSPGTIKQYTAEQSKFEKFRPGLLMTVFNHQLITNYVNYMRGDLKNTTNTVRKTLVRLQAMFQKAVDLKLIKENPLIGYKIPAYKQPQRMVLSPPEQDRIEDYADNGKSPMLRLIAAWFTLQMYSGLRYADLANWDEERMVRNGKLYFSDQKTKTPHYIPVYPALKRAIKRIRDFRSIPENQVCNRGLKEIAGYCGINIPLTTHVARHTFAVTYLDSGGSMDVLKELLGHANIRQTAIYGKISSKKIDEEAGRVWG